MAPRPDIVVPERTSSRFALEQKRMYLKESLTELKKNLSSISFDVSPVEYHKTKIAEIEIEIEDQKMHKAWLDIEYAERKLTDTNFTKAHRNTNRRIISLGDELWKQRKALRQLEENRGLAPSLGPDTEEGFVFAHLALYKDSFSTKRSTREQTVMRKAAIETYGSTDAAPPGKLWCPISQDYFDATGMRAAHIVPRMLGPAVLDYIFRAGTGSRLNTADNFLIVHNTAEIQMDNANFVLVPVDQSESPLKTWKICATTTLLVGMLILGVVFSST